MARFGTKSYDAHRCMRKWSKNVRFWVCMVITYSKRINQPDKVANPARGHLNRENTFFPCRHSRLRVRSRKTGSVVPSRVSLLILHTQAESDGFPRFPRRRPFDRQPLLGQSRVNQGHAIPYQCCSLPRVCRHRSSINLFRSHHGLVFVRHLFFQNPLLVQ